MVNCMRVFIFDKKKMAITNASVHCWINKENPTSRSFPANIWKIPQDSLPTADNFFFFFKQMAVEDTKTSEEYS